MKEEQNNPTSPSPTGGVRSGSDDIDAVIQNGIKFKGGGQSAKTSKNGQSNKVKTKAKKKQYITGAHGSAAAKKKADIRRKRANRHK